jgi:hypothetical protein
MPGIETAEKMFEKIQEIQEIVSVIGYLILHIVER